jgi:glycine/D-amino acid oxidase-like deaminating enzyme
MRMRHRSPWIHQLDHARPLMSIKSDIETDVVVVGAGIAGISSAYFILKNTDRKVVVVEKGKLAHGATGHNAGQIASYFERPFYELVDEFGLELAAQGQKSVEGAWQLLDSMYTEAGLSIPLSRFMGHAGFSTYDQVIRHLKDNACRKKAGLRTEEFRISETAPFVDTIPAEYRDFYEVVPHETVLSLLQTGNRDYVAALSYQKGCLNSALFSQEIALYLLKAYPERFALYEHTPIQKVSLHDGKAYLDADRHTITSGRVVLCTNGFEGFKIINEGGLAIDTKFHHLVRGMVGYMSAYIEPMNKPPTAISYFPPANTNSSDPYSEDPYFYLTRRQFDVENFENANLISVGGPEFSLEDRMKYDADLDYPEEEKARINAFVKSTYDSDPNRAIDYQFTWHGLMGYTPSGVRVVGQEPKNPVLLYNLGCNGVGILPSICGAQKIAEIIGGKKLDTSIFDPKS